MRQAVDVLAVFDVGAMSPRPIRFKVVEFGIIILPGFHGVL